MIIRSIYFFLLGMTILLMFPSKDLSQQNGASKLNTMYLEIGGNNVFYSLNYEREVLNNLSPRLGISIMPITEYSNSGKHANSKLFVTFMSNYFLTIKNSHKIELGGGLSYGLETFFPAFSIGYRYNPNDGGFIFKITFTPLLDKEIFDVFPWFGVGVGIRF